MASRDRCVAIRTGVTATRKMDVQIARVIVHVIPGWRARRRAGKNQEVPAESSVVRSDVRSAGSSRPRTGNKTSAPRTAKTALTERARKALMGRCESRSGDRAEENKVAVTSS